jgi:hypothetical protein
VEDVVESNVTKAQLIDGEFQLGLAVGAYQGARKIRADRQVEESVQRPFGSREIDGDLTWGSLGGAGRTGRDAGSSHCPGHQRQADTPQIQ